MKAVLSFIGFLFSTTILLGQSQQDLDTSWILNNPAVFNEAQAITKVLTRDVIVYNYTDRKYLVEMGLSKSGVIDSHAADIKKIVLENLKGRISLFWDINIKISGRSLEGGAMAPNGLYVATEPVISRRWGGTTPLLTQMVLAKGTRYINGQYRKPAMGPNLIKALNERGCQNPLMNRGEVFSTRSLIKADSNDKACRKALSEIAAALNVSAVLYLFLAEPVPSCKQVNSWNSAFVVISEKAIKERSIIPFTIEAPQHDDGLNDYRVMINESFTSSQLTPFFSSLESDTSLDYLSFVKENYFKCNPAIKEW